MKVLHVNDTDLRGRAFNGYDLLGDLETRGIKAQQAVLEKASDDGRVLPLFTMPSDASLNDAIERVEWEHGMCGLLYPWGRVLAATPEFRDADVVHYHLLHNRMISVLDLPWLFSQKPSVWTFHDAWPLTGHCIRPVECEGWMRECDPCPFPQRWFAMKTDCASEMWKVKRDVYSTLDADIVVASPQMLDMVRGSQLGSVFQRVHMVPFGVDVDAYPPDASKPDCRERLGIPADDFVVLFRAAVGDVKGTDVLIEALAEAPPERPTTLVSVDGTGLLKSLERDYRVIELGWVEDPGAYREVLCACDLFAMPSPTEAFGLMALEAMAAGRPVVCVEGTAVAALVNAPECGSAVPRGDSKALRAALDGFSADPCDVQRRGGAGRELAATEYRHDRYVDALVAIYQAAARRGKSLG